MNILGVIESKTLTKKVTMKKESMQKYNYNGLAYTVLSCVEVLFEELVEHILPDASLLFLGLLDEYDECA